MAVKITDLPSATALTGTEVVAGVQGSTGTYGGTVKVLISQIGTYVRALFTTTPATIAEGGTNAATAAAARTSLDVAQATNSLTEDTAPDKIADFLSAYDASAAAARKFRLITAVARAMPWGQGLLVNGKISATVAANALTLAVKGDDGNDPSATNPVYALFRSSTLTDAGFDIVPITAALSVVVSSGSTLGQQNNIAQHVFVYLINNAGAAEVAVSNLPPDYPGVFGKARLVSTTAEGGAGAADSATGVYSTTARSNVAWISVAKILTTQATAGTWAAAITQIDQAPFAIPTNPFYAYRSAAQTFAHATAAKVSYNTESSDPDGVYDAVTNYRFQPNVAGYYDISMKALWANLTVLQSSIGYIYKNGSEWQRVQYNSSGTISNECTALRILMNGTTDYLEGYVYQATGVNSDLGAGGSYNVFSGGRCANQGAS